ncbi:hypothetical protein L1887_05615 [Cichorium endivia]|nr:hypothetical protein L1887_05615 [Cichorium endivia]
MFYGGFFVLMSGALTVGFWIDCGLWSEDDELGELANRPRLSRSTTPTMWQAKSRGNWEMKVITLHAKVKPL